jgi:carbon-monoxide dehydrogenase medium subunit/2-furoyl-CoA dehydrogenase FAD binding subunit
VKLPAFEYATPGTVAEAVALLVASGGAARPLAGGQTLLPIMAFRLAAPALLVDMRKIPGLDRIDISAGGVALGARVRWCEIEAAEALQVAQPLLLEAISHVAHYQIRKRGTVGGSLAHADPSAELPLAALMLGATLRLRSAEGGVRDVAAADFFLGALYTAIGETECLVETEWPVWAAPAGSRVATAFDETAMRHGDFAMAAAACQLQLDADGRCTRAAIGLGGMDGVPLAFPDLAAQLVGQRVTATLAQDVAHAAAAQTQPGSDLHANADYRRELAAVLLARVLQQAAAGAPDPVTAPQPEFA